MNLLAARIPYRESFLTYMTGEVYLVRKLFAERKWKNKNTRRDKTDEFLIAALSI